MKKPCAIVAAIIFLLITQIGLAVQTGSASKQAQDSEVVGDCRLSGQIRKLQQNLTHLMPARIIKTTALECATRGGEFFGDSAVSQGENQLPDALQSPAE